MTPTQPWALGDHLGLPIPADADALLGGGAGYLTRALRAAGVLAEDNRVTEIKDLQEFSGGSTGRKASFTVAYQTPTAELPTNLFVKFSRDFADSRRDRGRFQMEHEIRFALLSRRRGFPITVPACLFADYHGESGTAILITERVPFGRNGIEPQYAKCLDHEMPDQLGHYRAIVSALGGLAGASVAGSLPIEVTGGFAAEMQTLTVGERTPATPEELRQKVCAYRQLTESHPAILPANIRSEAFIDRLGDEVVELAVHESAIWRYLENSAEFVALCHWNANVDNAWFWRNEGGQLECGLLDWGCVGRMNVAMAIWGAMCSAETHMWDLHLSELLRLFTEEFHRHGGPLLDVAEFEHQVLSYAGVMGVAWLLDVPRYLSRKLPSQVSCRTDPRIRRDEAIRSRLQMMTNFLNLWERTDLGRVLDRLP